MCITARGSRLLTVFQMSGIIQKVISMIFIFLVDLGLRNKLRIK